MTRQVTLIFSCVLMLAACSGVQSSNGLRSIATDPLSNDAVPATSNTFVIRSQAELRSYISASTKSGSPIDALSPAARSRFLSSITFNNNGITGFSYRDLQSELTASQVYKVLSLFGVQRDTALVGARIATSNDRAYSSVSPNTVPDYPNYYCEKHGTCAPYAGDICTGNC